MYLSEGALTGGWLSIQSFSFAKCNLKEPVIRFILYLRFPVSGMTSHLLICINRNEDFLQWLAGEISNEQLVYLDAPRIQS